MRPSVCRLRLSRRRKKHGVSTETLESGQGAQSWRTENQLHSNQQHSLCISSSKSNGGIDLVGWNRMQMRQHTNKEQYIHSFFSLVSTVSTEQRLPLSFSAPGDFLYLSTPHKVGLLSKSFCLHHPTGIPSIETEWPSNLSSPWYFTLYKRRS
jgi:hypothetical protein